MSASLPNSVAERRAQRAALSLTQSVLSLCKTKEVDNQRFELLFVQQFDLRRWIALTDTLIHFEHFSNTYECFTCRRVFRKSGFPELATTVRPTPHLFANTAVVFRVELCRRAKQDIVDTLGVGLNITAKAFEHGAHGGTGLFGCKLKEDVITVGDLDKIVSLTTGTTRAVLRRSWLDCKSSRIGQDAEGGLKRVLLGLSDHCGAKYAAEFLDLARHGAAVERELPAFENLLNAIQWQAITVFGDCDVGERRGRSHAARDELRRYRGEFELRVTLGIHSLVFHALDDKPTQASVFIGQLATLFKTYTRGFALTHQLFKQRVWNLNEHFGQTSVFELATTCRLRPLRPVLFAAFAVLFFRRGPATVSRITGLCIRILCRLILGQ